MARRILVVFAHPVLERSRVHRRLVASVGDLEAVTIDDLYESYPTLAIDVAREQALLSEHDAIVFQFPFYWYSCPAILKEWQDLVLQHGWAYGPGGDRLAGKIAVVATSTGGPADAYRKGGYNRFTIRELLAPWDQTAHLCGMRYLAPFVIHSSLAIRGDDDLALHRARYRRLLTGLRDDRLDLERAATAEVLDDDLLSPDDADGPVGR